MGGQKTKTLESGKGNRGVVAGKPAVSNRREFLRIGAAGALGGTLGLGASSILNTGCTINRVSGATFSITRSGGDRNISSECNAASSESRSMRRGETAEVQIGPIDECPHFIGRVDGQNIFIRMNSLAEGESVTVDLHDEAGNGPEISRRSRGSVNIDILSANDRRAITSRTNIDLPEGESLTVNGLIFRATINSGLSATVDATRE